MVLCANIHTQYRFRLQCGSPESVDPPLKGVGPFLLLLPDGVGIGSLLLHLKLIHHSIPNLSNVRLIISVIDGVLGTPKRWGGIYMA